MSTPAIMKLAEDLNRQLETIKTDQKYYKKESIKFQENIDILMLEFLNQDKLEKDDAEKLRNQIESNRYSARELEHESLKCSQLGQSVEQIKVEKELKV
jgi:predicted S18 family serine protease